MASHEHRLVGDPARLPAPKAKAAGAAAPKCVIEELSAATIRFAGDAGDAMQLIGTQFTNASTAHGNYVCTLPDPPAEIRAPVGTLAGVAGFQVQFSKHPIHTPGDLLHTLVAMNPAALKINLDDVQPGGTIIADSDAFHPLEWPKAGYTGNPLADGALAGYRVLAVPMLQLNRDAVANVKLSAREAERCKVFFALGLSFWLYDRPLEPTLHWIRETYAKNPALIEATTRSLKAGHQHGESRGGSTPRYRVAKAAIPAGRYRQITGCDAMVLGLLSASELSKLPMVFAGFPVAPASDLLHRLCEWKQPNATIVQAEDDLAAINIALGAAFGGALGATATTGPGLSLQSETLGLAVMSELPCVIIDIQRAGPSSGMPSKTEQADLLQALYGRHGECPLIVLAPATPADGFAIVIEAARLAIRFMTPVIVLADLQLARGAETWRVPENNELAAIEVNQARPFAGEPFMPYQRDARLARPWAVPGTPGLEHRTGGQEKEDRTGNVSYDPVNHERMVQMRSRKIAGAAQEMPSLSVDGPAQGELLVLGWGSTHGSVAAAAEGCRRAGLKVANAHLRHLLPMPKNTGDVLKRYRRILVPELNSGQLAQVLRSMFQVEVVSLCKVQGRPFLASEIKSAIEQIVSRSV